MSNSNRAGLNYPESDDAGAYKMDEESTPVGSHKRFKTGSSKTTDEDLIAWQIEPPTFIVELNPPDQNQQIHNDIIVQIESSFPANPPEHKKGYMPVIPMKASLSDEMKYYNHGYNMLEEGMFNQSMFDMQKDPEYMNKISSHMQHQWDSKYKQDQMQSYEGLMPKHTSPTQQSFDTYTNPDKFIEEISEIWNTIQEKGKEKHLKEFVVKFLAFQVIEVSKAPPAEKAFWDWWFSLFPVNVHSSYKFKHYSDVWLCFLMFKPIFWKKFALWHHKYSQMVVESSKNDYMKQIMEKWNDFMTKMILRTKNLSFERTENLYVAFLASMSKYSYSRETMIDDVSVEIEKYDPEKDPNGNEIKRLKLPKEFKNIDYLVENHSKLFNADYYKFLGISSIDDHPNLPPLEVLKDKMGEEEKEEVAQDEPEAQPQSDIMSYDQLQAKLKTVQDYAMQLHKKIVNFREIETNFLKNLPKELINAIVTNQAIGQNEGKYNISEFNLEKMIAEIRSKYMISQALEDLTS